MRLVFYRNKWAVEYYDGAERKRKSLGTRDRAEAEQKFALWRDIYERYRAGALGQVSDVLDGYQESLEGRPALARFKDIRKAYPKWLNELPVSSLTEAHCRQYSDLRAKAGRAQGTIWTELGYLRTALSWAEKRGLIDRSPPVWRPQKPRPKDRHLTRDEATRLIDSAVMPHVRLFIVLALSTAGRVGALVDLTWDRVDFANGVIRLDNPQKDSTAKGRATVPMTDRCRNALATAHKVSTTDHVIEWGGQPVKSIKKGFREACKRADLTGVTPHTLRHTAAVWMAEAEVPMEAIARYLGHTSTATTYRVYAKHSPSYLRKAASALEW